MNDAAGANHATAGASSPLEADVRRPRVLIGGLYHESHTFLPATTPLAAFEQRDGPALLQQVGDVSAIAGVVDVGIALRWDLCPASYWHATPSATAAEEVVARWWQRFRGTLRHELRRGVDAIFLCLHGAMASVHHPDVEGELLRRVRAVAGPETLIAGVTDLHANFSPSMAVLSDLLLTYRENPHTDTKATALRAAELLDRLLRAGRRPTTVFEQVPIVWPPTGTGTADPPMVELEAAARAVEAAEPEILAVNVHAGFSYADTHDTGVSFTASTLGDPARAQACLAELSALAWSLRERGVPAELPLEEAVEQVQRLLGANHGSGPVVLVEPSDNVGGGAPGDATVLLGELLARRLPNVGAALWDEEAVLAFAGCGPGTRRNLRLGGKGSLLGGRPLEFEAELIARSDGEFELEDIHSHGAAAGSKISMGPCAVVRPVGHDATILVTSRRTPPFDLGQWRSQGVDPAQFEVLVVKAAVAHRQAYDPIARAQLWVRTPGACPTDLRLLPYERIRRPIYPLDAVEEEPAGCG